MESTSNTERFRQIARSIGANTEDRDPASPWWVCSWPWEPLANANIESLHENLTAPTRHVGQSAIVNKLEEWTAVLQKVEEKFQEK